MDASRFLFLCVVLPQLCHAENNTCQVIQGSKQTSYNPPYEPQPMESECTFSYSAKSAVLAHQNGKNETLVISNTISTLITRVCFPMVIVKRSCPPQGEELTFTCSANCSENALSLEDKDGKNPPEAENPVTVKDTFRFWIAIAVAVFGGVGVVFVLAFLLLVILIQFKKIKFFYSPAKTGELQEVCVDTVIL